MSSAFAGVGIRPRLMKTGGAGLEAAVEAETLGLGLLGLGGTLVPLDASAHIEATAVTRPPRPPRADLTLYFIST